MPLAAASVHLWAYCNSHAPPTPQYRCHRGNVPHSFRTVLGFFNLPFNFDWWKKDEWDKANDVTSPPNDAIILTETSSQITASMISPVFQRPWLLVWPEFEPSTFHSADQCPPNWANRAAVTDSGKFFLMDSRIQGFGIRYSTQGIRFPTGIKEPGIRFL